MPNTTILGQYGVVTGEAGASEAIAQRLAPQIESLVWDIHLSRRGHLGGRDVTDPAQITRAIA